MTLLQLDPQYRLVGSPSKGTIGDDVDGVVDGGSPGKDLGVVHVEVGVDEVDIAVDGGRIDGQVREVGVKGLGGRDTVDRGQLHDLLVDERTILYTVKGVLALVDLEASLGGRGE